MLTPSHLPFHAPTSPGLSLPGSQSPLGDKASASNSEIYFLPTGRRSGWSVQDAEELTSVPSDSALQSCRVVLGFIRPWFPCLSRGSFYLIWIRSLQRTAGGWGSLGCVHHHYLPLLPTLHFFPPWIRHCPVGRVGTIWGCGVRQTCIPLTPGFATSEFSHFCPTLSLLICRMGTIIRPRHGVAGRLRCNSE